MLVRPRFWHRRWVLVLSYALVAVGASGIAVTAAWVMLATIAHMARHAIP